MIIEDTFFVDAERRLQAAQGNSRGGEALIARVVEWCTRRYRLVLVVAAAGGLGGELSRRSLSRDAVPDLSDPQIGVVVDWMGHPATEVATRVTQVLTDALRSVPGTAVRGSSMSGMAYVDVVFGVVKQPGTRRQEIISAWRTARSSCREHARADRPRGVQHRVDLSVRARQPTSLGLAVGRDSSRTTCCARRWWRSRGWPRWRPSAKRCRSWSWRPSRSSCARGAWRSATSWRRCAAKRHGDPDLQHIELCRCPAPRRSRSPPTPRSSNCRSTSTTVSRCSGCPARATRCP